MTPVMCVVRWWGGSFAFDGSNLRDATIDHDLDTVTVGNVYEVISPGQPNTLIPRFFHNGASELQVMPPGFQFPLVGCSHLILTPSEVFLPSAELTTCEAIYIKRGYPTTGSPDEPVTITAFSGETVEGVASISLTEENQAVILVPIVDSGSPPADGWWIYAQYL